MYLRNFERSWPSGAPISGATITIYPASLTDVHVSPVTFTDHNGVSGSSTTTNAYGMWAATNLPDGAFYDVKVEYNSKVKWYFGRTMHSVEHMTDDKSPALNRNIIRNGGKSGWNAWVRRGSTTIPGISTAPVEIEDFWYASVSGGGDSATGTRAAASGIASAYVSEIAYTRVGGNFTHSTTLTASEATALRSKTVSVTIAMWQNGNARVKPFIQDSAGITYGAVLTATSAWTVVTATRTIDAAATSVVIGYTTDTPSAGVYTIRSCMALADYGATLPVYTTMPFDAGLTTAEADRYLGPYTIDDTQVLGANLGYASEVHNSLARRVKEIIGAAAGTWLSAVPRTLTQLYADVQAAQTTANSGVANAAVAQTTANTGVANAAAAQSTANSANTNANTRVLRAGDGMTGPLSVVANAPSSIMLLLQNAAAGTNGIAIGVLNAAGSAFDWIAEHNTFTVNIAMAINNALTVSGAITGSSTIAATGAITSGGNNVQARATHTGQQAPGTISPQGSGSGLDADTVDGSHASAFATSGHTHTNSANSSYTGTGGVRVVANALGFQPRMVIVNGASIAGIILRDNNTITFTYGGSISATAGGSLDASGFTVPAILNVSGTYTWSAFA